MADDGRIAVVAAEDEVVTGFQTEHAFGFSVGMTLRAALLKDRLDIASEVHRERSGLRQERLLLGRKGGVIFGVYG